MRILALLAACLLVGSLPLVTANHPQPGDSGETIVFDHRTGNEWWVEVKINLTTSEPENVHVDRVEARDDGGPWVELKLKSWGAYAASFHIEPGHRVQFRAAQHGGMSDARVWESCWFTHPAGVEQCTTTPPPPPPPPGNFTFTHGGGNEWWLEVKVDPMPGKVEAMDTNGAWMPLSFRHWGEWANSFHIEPGNQVRFRAHSNDAWHESCWFTHPQGQPVGCSTTPPPPPPPGDFDATFKNVRGNDWWVETDVTVSGGTLAGVDARMDGGSWIPLDKKSWGSWAKSFHVPDDAMIEFRARATDGSADVSQPYTWPPA